MRALKIPLIIISSFTIGIVVYFAVSNFIGANSNEHDLKQKKPLRILAYQEIFPKALTDKFSERTGIQVLVTEASTPEKLWSKLESDRGTYDLVSLYSYQIPLASQMSKTSPTQSRLIPEIAAVSADFINIPGEIGHSRVVPLLWGITGIAHHADVKISEPFSLREYMGRNSNQGSIGYLSSTADLHYLVNRLFPAIKPGADETAQLLKNIQALIASGQLSDHHVTPISLFKSSNRPGLVQVSHGEAVFLPKDDNGKPRWNFIIPEEGALFWILSLALVQDSDREDSAYAFLKFILEEESSLTLTKYSRQATTHRALENSDLHENLKASYLRKIPLMKYHLWQDFSRAREIRDVIDKSNSAKQP